LWPHYEQVEQKEQAFMVMDRKQKNELKRAADLGLIFFSEKNIVTKTKKACGLFRRLN